MQLHVFSPLEFTWLSDSYNMLGASLWLCHNSVTKSFYTISYTIYIEVKADKY